MLSFVSSSIYSGVAKWYLFLLGIILLWILFVCTVSCAFICFLASLELLLSGSFGVSSMLFSAIYPSKSVGSFSEWYVTLPAPFLLLGSPPLLLELSDDLEIWKLLSFLSRSSTSIFAVVSLEGTCRDLDANDPERDKDSDPSAFLPPPDLKLGWCTLCELTLCSWPSPASSCSSTAFSANPELDGGSSSNLEGRSTISFRLESYNLSCLTCPTLCLPSSKS